MRAPSVAAAALAGAPRSARRLLLLLAFYLLADQLFSGSSFLEASFSAPAIALGAAVSLLFVASAAAAVLDGAAPWRLRVAQALARAGLAIVLAAVPASLTFRVARGLPVGEGQEISPEEIAGLPPLRFGRVTLAPSNPHPLLSKSVRIEAWVRDEAERLEVGLFPPARLGSWALSVTRFGYAPGLDLWDASGRPIVQGWVMLGTFPHTEQEERLVTWTPAPNVMMGVGTFPPKLEDLISPPGSPWHLFLRIDEAEVGGIRRDLRGPDAHRFVLDGRLEHPRYFVQVFRGNEKVWEGRLRGDEEASFPGGRARLSDDVVLWVDLLAVWDPWLYLMIVGALAVAAGLLLRLTVWSRAAPPTA